MTVENIWNTITTAAPQTRDYPGILDSVVGALVEREYRITEALVERATTEHPVSEGPVRELAQAAGLAVRPAGSEEDGEDEYATLRAELAEITDKIAALNSRLG